MGFGLELGKSVAKAGANMLTGGLVDGIMGLFGGSGKAEQRQYQHEKEMMAQQNKYNTHNPIRTGVKFYEVSNWRYNKGKEMYEPVIRRIVMIRIKDTQLSLDL